jgi:hypothetical protein
METNNVISAPQVENVDAVYAEWQKSHSGSRKKFYTFMSTPSADRDEFINSIGGGPETKFNGAIVSVTIKMD